MGENGYNKIDIFIEKQGLAVSKKESVMIKKFYFENFKGFIRAEMAVENMTTIIGTNASGKTNTIEGMKILSELMTGRDLSTILDGSKNMDSDIRGGSRGCCRFNLSQFQLGCLFEYNETCDLEYKVKIKVNDRIMIESESLHEIIRSQPKKMLFATKTVRKDSGDINVSYNNGKPGTNPEISCIRISSVISQIPTKLPQNTEQEKHIAECAMALMEKLKNMLFLNPDPAAMRGYSRINDTELKVNASNLSAVLNKLCKDKGKKEILLQTMRQLPENEITEITFEEGPMNDVILFLREKYATKKEKIDATRLSDGTLRCLAVMAALLTEEPGGMIVIEEVDNGIHPGRAKSMIQTISQLARERRVDVIITTHNAVMLNALTKEDLVGVNVIYRGTQTGESMFVSLVDIPDMPGLLAEGKLGDVVTSGRILEYIKEPIPEPDYSWMEV